MNKKNLIRAGLVLASIAAIIIITQLLKSPGGTADVEPPVRPVKTMEVQTTPGQFRRIFPGRLQASQTVNLSFLNSGDLVEFPVQEGDRLEPGDLIARMDARDAQSALDAARADLNLANVELERNQTLFDEELISAAEFDIKRRGFDVSLAAFETASKAVEDREIRAPFQGVLAKRFVENFEKVQAGQTIVTFFDPTGIEIVIDIPESVVMQYPHYTSVFSAEFEQSPGNEYNLDVKEFATVADPYTKTYALTLNMERPEGFLILPDMTVSVNVDFTRKAAVADNDFLVPSTSIVYDVETDSSVIWVVDTNTMTVNPVPVIPDRSQGGEVVILDGIKPGDTIVTAGGGFLNRDQKIRIFE